MNVTAWSYSSAGHPYICVENQLCEARIGTLRCVEIAGHDGPCRYPMGNGEQMLWLRHIDGEEHS